MTLNECLEFCKICQNRHVDFKTGLICSLTNEKPQFEDSCKDFLKDEKEARLLTMLTHEKGSSIVGTYPHDVARSRIDTVEVLKKDVGFPLTFKILPE